MWTDPSWATPGDQSLFFFWGYSVCDLFSGLTVPAQIFQFIEEATDLLLKHKEGSYDNQHGWFSFWIAL